jgi:hypothetical protein
MSAINIDISPTANYIQIGVPTAPSSLTATADGGYTRIKLAWTDNSDNEDGFRIERSPDDAAWVEIATVGSGVITYQNSGLDVGTQYYYRVRAYNDGGNSDYTSSANATTFDPDTLTPISWGEANDIAGDDGDAISTYDDKQSNTWAQGTGSKQPLLKKGANGINGHNVIRFDGTDDLLRYAGTLSTSASGTIFIVHRFTSAIQDTQTLLSSSDEASTSYYWLCRYHTSGLPHLYIAQTDNDAESSAYAADETIVADRVYVSQFASDGANYGLRIDRQEYTRTQSGTQGDWFGDTSNRDNVILGALKRSSEIHFLKGDIAEWLIFDSHLSASNKQKVEDYLTEKYKYSVSLSVGAVHAVPSPDVFATGVAAGNLSAAGGDELVFGSGTSPIGAAGTVTALDKDGNNVFTYNSPSNDYALGLALGDVDGDSDNEVAVGFHTDDHIGVLLNNAGGLVWSWSTVAGYHTYIRCAAIGELDSAYDGKEVVFGGGIGTLALLESDGTEIWVKEGLGSLSGGVDSGSATTVQSIAIGDLDIDAQNEIVISYALTVKNIDKDGGETWSKTLTTGSSYIFGVAVGQITSATGREVVAVGGTAVFLLDKDGNTLWQKTLPELTWSVVTYDINSSGFDEIFVGYGEEDTTGWIAVLDSAGQEIGSIKVGESPKFLAVGDVDDDGDTELIVSSDDGNVYILDIDV